jgi:hypothetical protein
MVHLRLGQQLDSGFNPVRQYLMQNPQSGNQQRQPVRGRRVSQTQDKPDALRDPLLLVQAIVQTVKRSQGDFCRIDLRRMPISHDFTCQLGGCG